MNKLFAFVTTLIIFAVAATAVNASGESNCQVVYGGGEVCDEQLKFTINKMVQNPESSKGGNAEYVENLTINDARYGAGQNVNFKIVIENTGNRAIQNLNVIDSLPEYLKFVSGAGVIDQGSNKLTFVIEQLAAGDKKEFIITAKTTDTQNLPANQSITCVTNNVVATADDSATAEDNAQLCIEKKIAEKPTVTIAEKPTMEKIPATGPEMALLFGLIPAAAAGLFIRKKTN